MLCEIWQAAVYRALQIISCIRPGHSKTRGWLNVVSRTLDQCSDRVSQQTPSTSWKDLHIANFIVKIFCSPNYFQLFRSQQRKDNLRKNTMLKRNMDFNLGIFSTQPFDPVFIITRPRHCMITQFSKYFVWS